MTDTVGLELVWANAGGFADPGDAKYQLGWVAEIPTFQNFNFVLQALDRAKLSYAEKDIHLWQDNIAYASGARVERGDRTFYCITAHNDAAGSNPQDPLLDTTNSYWVNSTVFSSQPNAFTNLNVKDGILVDRLQPRASSTQWNGNDLTINNLNSIIGLTNDSPTEDNFLFGNVGGKIVVVNIGNTKVADDRSIAVGTANKSYEVYHEGNKPTQSEVSGTIPDSPADGKLYARQSGNWVEVTSTTVRPTPPAAAVGAGRGWYNLEDGQFYIDIYDGDTSQWVPANPPVVPDLAPIEQRVADVSNAFVGMESYFPPLAGDGVHPAWIEKAGGEFSRTAYPSLYAWAVAHNLVVTEANWQAIKTASPNGSVAVFSSGDGSTTFRVPDVGEQGGFARAIKGNTGATPPVGDLNGGFEDQIQNITGSMGSGRFTSGNTANFTGAFGLTYADLQNWGSDQVIYAQGFNFDASRVARTGTETSPRGFYQRVYIYTGNIVEDLPTPTPDWLAQQEVNTNAITDLQQDERTWSFPTRVEGITYTNNTGRDIEVMTNTSASAGGCVIELYLDGILRTREGAGTSDATRRQLTFTVKHGETYRVSLNTDTIELWAEKSI